MQVLSQVRERRLVTVMRECLGVGKGVEVIILPVVTFASFCTCLREHN